MDENEGGSLQSCRTRVGLGLGCDPELWGGRCPVGSGVPSAVRAFPAPELPPGLGCSEGRAAAPGLPAGNFTRSTELKKIPILYLEQP